MGGDSGPRLAFSATSRCREVASHQRLGGRALRWAPGLQPMLGISTPGPHARPAPSGGGGGGSRVAHPPPPPSTSPPRAPRLRPRARTVTRAHLAPGQPCACPPARSPARGPLLRPRPRRRLAPRADLAAPRTPLPGAQVSRATARHSPAPGAPAARARPIGSARRARRSRRTVNRALPARPQPAAIPRAARPCAWRPGRSRAEPPRGRTGKRGWSRPSPRCAALARCPPSRLACRLAHQASLLLPALRILAKCPGLCLGSSSVVRLPRTKTAPMVPSRACSLRSLHSNCPLDRALRLTSFWYPEIQVALVPRLSPGLSYNGH